MKQIILGTAGHIDHGKTSLIKAVTGIETDRLKEEKERGITIELGFASLDLPSGEHLGIVDVPGHEKFVKNMVAGATGIDIVVMFNADLREHSFELDFGGAAFDLHPMQQSSADPVVRSARFDRASQVFTVPPRSTAVFMRTSD